MKIFTKKSVLAITGIAAVFLFNACSETEEHKEFISKYGSDHRYYCDKETGFYMHSMMLFTYHTPNIEPVVNDLHQPTRCPGAENVNVSVVETSSASSRVF